MTSARPRSSLRNRAPLPGITVAILCIEHTMTRAMAFLLVLTLTTLPAASAVCVTWCESRPATTLAHCHQDEAPAISSAQTACAALKDSPFLRQDVRVALNAVLGPMLATVSELSHARQHGTMLTAGSVPRGAPTQHSLVLRL
jgi:hypothetical protein